MGIFGNSGDNGDDGGLRRRVEELERRVAALEWAARSAGQAVPTAVVGQPGDAGVRPEIQQLVMQGKKIQAIKLLREQSGLGLREAKDIVDRL
jgi:ribosomal protein L7/L12